MQHHRLDELQEEEVDFGSQFLFKVEGPLVAMDF